MLYTRHKGIGGNLSCTYELVLYTIRIVRKINNIRIAAYSRLSDILTFEKETSKQAFFFPLSFPKSQKDVSLTQGIELNFSCTSFLYLYKYAGSTSEMMLGSDPITQLDIFH